MDIARTEGPRRPHTTVPIPTHGTHARERISGILPEGTIPRPVESSTIAPERSASQTSTPLAPLCKSHDVDGERPVPPPALL